MGAGVQGLQQCSAAFPGHKTGAGLEMEQLEPKPVPFETQALQVET